MGLFKKQKTDLNKNIFEGSSIQQAVSNAAEALKVPLEQISYDVISYGSTGVFGLVGNKRAKIRVRSNIRVKEKALSATEKYWREIQEEQENFASKELNREKQNAKSKDESGKPKTAAKDNNNRRGKQRVSHKEPVNAAAAVEKTEKTAETALKEKTARRSRNRKRAPKNVHPETMVNETAEACTATPQEPLTGQLAQAYDVLQGIAANLMDTPFQLAYKVAEKKITFVFQGESLSPLIGKNGNTRRSLQLMADRVINKGGQSKYDVSVLVDTVRQNKSKQMLLSLAKKKADQCRKTKEEISLGFMNSYERCIIHIALKRDPDVETKSIGEGAQKEIFIVPAKGEKIFEPENIAETDAVAAN